MNTSVKPAMSVNEVSKMSDYSHVQYVSNISSCFDTDRFTSARQYCIPNPCKNGGTCFPEENGYRCACLSNFEGNDCESKLKHLVKSFRFPQ